MLKLLRLGLIGLVLSCSAAMATPCTSYPNPLSNGTTANGSDVIGNLTYMSGCLAPLASPNFTGNVGFGATSPQSTLSVNGGVAIGTTYAGTNAAGSNNLIVQGAVSIGTPVPILTGSVSHVVSISSALNPSSNSLYLGGGTWGAGLDFDATATGSGGHTYQMIASNNANGIGGGKWVIYDFTMSASRLLIDSSGNVGIGTTTPAQALEVNGEIQVDSLASASSTNLCISSNVISSCSSSIRYKENVNSASFGLQEVEAMRPVTFKWKGRAESDFGFIAEEVAKINPLFVTYKNGMIEGVKYPQLTAVLVNAVKQLKAVDDAQARQIADLKARVDELHRELVRQAGMRSAKSLPTAYTTAR